MGLLVPMQPMDFQSIVVELEGYQEVLADLKDTKKSQFKELEQDKKQSWLKQQLKKLNINPKELSVEREKGEYTL